MGTTKFMVSQEAILENFLQEKRLVATISLVFSKQVFPGHLAPRAGVSIYMCVCITH